MNPSAGRFFKTVVPPVVPPLYLTSLLSSFNLVFLKSRTTERQTNSSECKVLENRKGAELI